MRGREITVRKLHYDGTAGYTWQGWLLEETLTSAIVEAVFTRADRDLGYVVLEQGGRWIETYYFDRCYNVFEIYGRSRELKGWYCNVCLPAKIDNGELTFVDLALDVFARADGSFLVLDEDEFASYKASLYRPEDVAAAERGLAELKDLARASRLPYHPELVLDRLPAD